MAGCIGTGDRGAPVQKLERTSAHLRRLSSTTIPFSLSALNTALDECLGHFPIDRGTGVLPVHQKVPPNSRTWVETMSVMPPVKGRRKRAGDKAYGAGESSGKKAKNTGQVHCCICIRNTKFGESALEEVPQKFHTHHLFQIPSTQSN